MKNGTVAVIVVIVLIIGVGLFFFYNRSVCGDNFCFMTGSVVNVPDSGENVNSGETVAIYNGKMITKSELDKTYDFFFFMNGLPETYKSQLPKKTYLNQMLTQRVVYDEAKSKGYDMGLEETEQTLETTLEQSELTLESLKERIENQSFDYEFLINEFNRQLVITKFVNETVTSKIVVGDDEIEDFYNENKEFMEIPEQIKASHILVKTEEEAKDMILKLENNEDFAELAREFSTGPSSVNGGDLGFFGKGAMVKEFEDAAYGLNVGEYTKEPVQTQFGYHVILLTDKREAKTLSLEEARQDIYQQLLAEKQRQEIEDFLNKLESEASVEVFL
jgi:peptidyl-prolyl cis-trans isomerase C/foldase protein PrsA